MKPRQGITGQGGAGEQRARCKQLYSGNRQTEPTAGLVGPDVKVRGEKKKNFFFANKSTSGGLEGS